MVFALVLSHSPGAMLVLDSLVCFEMKGSNNKPSLFLTGNHMLLRVLPSIYPRQPDIIHRHLGNLTAMMSQLEPLEQQHLLRLIQIVAEQHPLVSVCRSVRVMSCNP